MVNHQPTTDKQKDKAVSRDVLPVNPDLAGDYEIPEDGYQDEGLRR
jgi:hypothetical protein